ncbi:MAG: YcbK family protein, partial [Gammaproteobacteria bacterium]
MSDPRKAGARRQFLRRAGAGCLGLAAFPLRTMASSEPRELSFRHTHTGEKLELVFAEGPHYVPEALDAINEHLRDFRTGEIWPIATEVLEILHAARSTLAPRGVFEVISGYRSPRTNDMLRQKSGGVAKRSLHMSGRAVDVRLVGVSTADMMKFCRRLGAGGVGYYARSDFVHL